MSRAAAEPGTSATAHPAETAPAVALRDVSVVRGGRTVWSEGTLAVPRGAVVGVIGPNGAGKTTLFQVILGLLPVASGRVEVLGEPPRRGNRRIGYVPQNYTTALGGAVRGRDLVTLGVTGDRFGLRRASRDERARVEEALRRVGAAGYADRRMSQLSGGQQQRIAIAQAIVDHTELLLLDEPLANLDMGNQHEVVELLGDLNRDRHVTVMIVAHDLNPLLPVLTDAVYLLDGHPHHAPIGEVVHDELLTHLYGTSVRVVRTPQGDLFTEGKERDR